MLWLIAEGVRCTFLAAATRLPLSATAQNTLNTRVSISSAGTQDVDGWLQSGARAIAVNRRMSFNIAIQRG